MASTAKPVARRGRPPSSDGRETSARLLEAAAAVCAEYGFDGATMGKIAAATGLTPAAIYNHFGSREDLLYAAGVRGLEQMTAVAGGRVGEEAVRAIAAAYLRPAQRQTRRLLAELHLAGGRDPRLARLLASWHRTWADQLRAVLPPDDPDPDATAKALFLLLLGLCHLDDLPAVKASPAAVAARIDRFLDAAFP
jgi:AcrR family transcriptional regulator